MSRRVGLTLAFSSVLIGSYFARCDDVQADDLSNSHLKQAQQDLDNNKPGEAAAEYEDALTANPKLASAEYELGILYSEKLHDSVSSIFHLRRFLKLAPGSDHAANAQQIIDKETKAFAATVPSDNSDLVAKLQSENTMYKNQLDDAAHTITLLQGQLAQSTKTPAPAAGADASTAAPVIPSGPQKALPIDQMNPNVPAPTAPGAPVADAGPSRSYTVVKGDKIWTIAKKMYPGHTKEGVDKIEEANKDNLGNKPLKIGQVLVIPQ